MSARQSFVCSRGTFENPWDWNTAMARKKAGRKKATAKAASRKPAKAKKGKRVIHGRMGRPKDI